MKRVSHFIEPSRSYRYLSHSSRHTQVSVPATRETLYHSLKLKNYEIQMY